MDTASILGFAGLVALGSYIQTVSGFAFALVLMGGVAALNLAPIAFTANVMSFVALAHIYTAVHGKYQVLDREILLYASIGLFCLTGVGLVLLSYLSSQYLGLLEMLLGLAILVCGAALMMRPQPLQKPSPKRTHVMAGSIGGLLSGLFGVGGPALVIHIYRQPLEFSVVRLTLLAGIGIMTLIRIGFEVYRGNITESILTLSFICIPVSIVVTLLASRFPPRASIATMKRFAFSLLCVMGLLLVLRNI